MEKHFKKIKGKDHVNFLEIGIYDGRSTIWFIENILTNPTSKIALIDKLLINQHMKILNII